MIRLVNYPLVKYDRILGMAAFWNLCGIPYCNLTIGMFYKKLLKNTVPAPLMEAAFTEIFFNCH